MPPSPLDQIIVHADPEKATQMAAYHKAQRRYLGVANPVLDDLARGWRASLDIESRVALARDLWDSDIHEARIAAAKLFTQARIRPDDAVWDLIQTWVPQFDGWAIADHACMAGQRRLTADPDRIDTVAAWTGSDHMWTRRAALVITLPWTKMRHPKPEDIARRVRILEWAAGYASDRDWFIQKAVGWWLRELGRHDPDRVRAFLVDHGDVMRGFARKEATRRLPPLDDPA